MAGLPGSMIAAAAVKLACFALEFRQSDLQQPGGRQVDVLARGQHLAVNRLADGEAFLAGLGQTLLGQPVRVGGQCRRRPVVDRLELRLERRVLDALDGLDQIVRQEVRAAPGDVDGQLDEGFGQHRREVLARGGVERRGLPLGGDDAAQAVGERREVALEVGVHVQRARVGDRVAVEGAHFLQLQEVVVHPQPQQLLVEGRGGAEFGGIDGRQLGLEAVPAQAFRVDGGAAEVHELAVELVQAQAHGVERLESGVVRDDFVRELGEGDLRRDRRVLGVGGRDAEERGGEEQIEWKGGGSFHRGYGPAGSGRRRARLAGRRREASCQSALCIIRAVRANG